ncbi:MAG: sigma-54 dependent transcriptional regulator [Nitrospiraceae bacterium]
MGSLHVLVVEDDPAVRSLIQSTLSEDGWEVAAAADGRSAIQQAQDRAIDVLLIDLHLPDMDGVAVIEQVAALERGICSVAMTADGTDERAVRARRAGARDFIKKPFDPARLSQTLERAAQSRQARRGEVGVGLGFGERQVHDVPVGISASMQAIMQVVKLVADSDSTVLIQGESGTGKEVLARMLHARSSRCHGPWIPINCGAIPEQLLESELFGHEKGAFSGAHSTRPGRFELAHRGTIFLDEIGELSLSLQVKLLRVIQERCFERVGGTRSIAVDVRIVAATNQDLEQAVRQGRFRKDLYYRLNVIPIVVPPLRDRRNDLPLLIEHFLGRFNRLKRASIAGLAPDAVRALMRYEWPGNIRELENLIERLVVLKRQGLIELEDIPMPITRQTETAMRPEIEHVSFAEGGIDLMREVERFENRLIVEALAHAKGITSKAARLLRLNRTTLVEKLKRKGLGARPPLAACESDPRDESCSLTGRQ